MSNITRIGSPNKPTVFPEDTFSSLGSKHGGVKDKAESKEVIIKSTYVQYDVINEMNLENYQNYINFS